MSMIHPSCFYDGLLCLRQMRSGIWSKGNPLFDRLVYAIGNSISAAEHVGPPGPVERADQLVHHLHRQGMVSDIITTAMLPIWERRWAAHNGTNQAQAHASAPPPAPAPQGNLIDAALRARKASFAGQGILNSGSGNPFDYKLLPKRIEIRGGMTIFSESKWADAPSKKGPT